MTTAIDEATAVLEEAATLAEGSEPSAPDPVADAVDLPTADAPDDSEPSDADAVDETATVEPEVPTADESLACAEADPELDSDALIAEDAPPSEPTPDQSPTPSVVSGGTDPQMHELAARLKGVSEKISRAIDRLGTLEGENRDQARTIERSSRRPASCAARMRH